MINKLKKNPEDFRTWLELQRYKRYHPLGVRFAIWWLRVRYGWDDEEERFVR